MENEKGKWGVYLGIAVEDKVYDSRLLKVYITEIAPYISGEIKDLTGKESISIMNDEKGKKEEVEVNSTNILTCEYFGLATNRVFPPDVRKGEQILVIRYRDLDRYYWVSLGRDDRLRRKEIFRLAVSDDDKIDKKLEEENTYFIEMDTLFDKRIRLITSKADGEKYKYSIVIDAKNHYVSVYDDDDNYFILESDRPRIKMKNRSKSLIDINDEDIFIACKRDVSIHAGRQFVLKTPQETRVIDNVSVLKTNKHTIKADSITMDCPAVQITGVLKALNMVFTPLTVSGAYNTGPTGSKYPEGETNVAEGAGSNLDSADPGANPGTGARNATAWQQNHANMQTIFTCLSNLKAIHSGGPHSCEVPCEPIPSVSAASKMPLNKGE